MRWLRLLAVFSLPLVLPNTARGQDVQPELMPGMRVLVTIPTDAPQRRTSFRRVQLISGDITRATRDTIYLRPAPRLGELAIPLAEVKRLDLSRGVPSRTASALIGGMQQGLTFALAGALLYSDPGRRFGVTSRGEAAAVGAGFGFLGGAVIGAIAPFERWKRVKLP